MNSCKVFLSLSDRDANKPPKKKTLFLNKKTPKKINNKTHRRDTAHTHTLFFSKRRFFYIKKNTDATVALFDQLQVDYECIDCLDEERNPGLREVFFSF
jgi:hypothetical protein